MGTLFTDDDVDKTVESADGNELGVVAAVDEGTAYIEPSPGITDSIKATLDWETDSDDLVPLADDSVGELTNETVRLETAVPADNAARGTSDSATREQLDTPEETASEQRDTLEEMASIDEEASRDIDVDPTELTDQDPEAQVRPEEDVGQRTDAHVEPADISDEGDYSDGQPAADTGAVESETDAERDRRTDDEDSVGSTDG